jgi:hypothetical protein
MSNRIELIEPDAYGNGHRIYASLWLRTREDVDAIIAAIEGLKPALPAEKEKKE